MLRLRSAFRVCKQVQSIKPAAAVTQQRSYATEVAKTTTQTQPAAEEPELTQNWWDAFDELIESEEGKRHLREFKAMADEMRNKKHLADKPLPTVDWEYYHKRLDPYDPEIVASYEQVFKTMEVPEFDPSPIIAEGLKAFEELEKQAAELAAHSRKRMKELEVDMKRIEEQKAALSTLTIDEALAAEPELAAEIDREIAEGKW